MCSYMPDTRLMVLVGVEIKLVVLTSLVSIHAMPSSPLKAHVQFTMIRVEDLAHRFFEALELRFQSEVNKM